MKTLVVEDDFSSRKLLQALCAPYGECHVAVNGKEAVTAFLSAIKDKTPYDLICMDIMMLEMDGQAALKEIRELEKKHGVAAGDGVKIIMTTALNDKKSVMTAFRELCDAYLVKPIDKAKLLVHLRSFGLVE